MSAETSAGMQQAKPIAAMLLAMGLSGLFTGVVPLIPLSAPPALACARWPWHQAKSVGSLNKAVAQPPSPVAAPGAFVSVTAADGGEALTKGLAQSLTLADAQALQQGYDQAMLAIAKALPAKRAVVLDLDETLIDNRAYFIEHGPYNEALWEQWVLTAQAPALPGAADFVRFLEAHQVPYYFISGRREKWRTATDSNLKALGFGGYRQLLLKPDDYPKGQSPQQFKEDRRCAIERMTNQPVYLLMGDQVSDLTGACAGEVQIKLPNRLYELP